MPRIRTIKPEFWQDELIGALRRDTRQLYLGLISMADDQGRFRASPLLVRSQVFPYDNDVDVAGGLAELEAHGRVQLYVADGQRFGWIRKFEEHQRIDKPTKSRFPPPPQQTEFPSRPLGLPEPSKNPPGVFVEDSQGEGKGREGIKEGKGEDLEALSISSTAGDEVFAYWREKFGIAAHAKFKGKRRKAVLARLKDYSPEQLRQAIDGCALTPHNMGENDRGERYIDLELICRDVEHVERFMANALDPPKPRGKANGVAASNTDKDWSHQPETIQTANGREIAW